MGNNATANGLNAVAIGNNSSAIGGHSTVVGSGSVAEGVGSVALGQNALAKKEDSVAVGMGAKANAENSVALGTRSVADRANTVSVGLEGYERQITNLANGTALTDAVNVRQMNELSNGLNKRISDVSEQSNAGIAGAYAMSSIATAPIGKRGVAFGTGFYDGESAVAIGFTQTESIKDNKAVAIKINGSADSQGKFGAALGATYFF